MKRFLAFLLATMMLLSLVSCGSNNSGNSSANGNTGSNGENANSSETYVLKFASTMTKEEALGQQMEELAAKIEEYTNGQVTVETYYNGELGTDADVCELIQQGANIFGFSTLDFLASYSFDMSILDGPFFFYEPEEINTLKESDWWDGQMENLANQNLYCLDTIYFGARSIIHKEGPDADSPEDFKGVCMRTANTPMRYAMCEAITGNVTTASWSEIYSALSTGVADMCEAPLASIIGTKIYEVCPYITLDEHIHAFIGIYAAKDWMDALPADVQEGIRKAVSEIGDASIEFVKADEITSREFLEEQGVTFIEVQDKDAWAEATRTAYDALDFTEGTYETCMEILGH